MKNKGLMKTLSAFLSVVILLSSVSFSNLMNIDFFGFAVSAAEESSSENVTDVSEAIVKVTTILDKKSVSEDDIVTVKVKLDANYYVTVVQLPVIYDKTKFEIVGAASDSSYLTFNSDSALANGTYTTNGSATKTDGFKYTSNADEWNTDEAMAQYAYAWITASPNANASDFQLAMPQDDVFVSFQVKALTDVEDATQSIFISPDWTKTADVKRGQFTVGFSADATEKNALNYTSTGITYELETVAIISAEEIVLNYTEVTLSKDDPVVRLQATVYPENAADKSVEWLSSNDDVVIVDEDGLVTRVGEGSATITAINSAGQQAICSITVIHECDFSTLTRVEAVDSDCYNDGNIEYYECACGKLYLAENAETEISSEEIIIFALGHTEAETVVENNVAPDCVNEGSYDTVVYCTVCGGEVSRVTTTVPALGHTEGETVVENNVVPDCVNEGSYDTVVCCTVCGGEVSRVTTTVPAFGHTEGEWETVENPTLESTGLKIAKCTVCGEIVRTEVIPAYKVVLTVMPDKTIAVSGDEINYTVTLESNYKLGSMAFRTAFPAGLEYVDDSGVIDPGAVTALGLDEIVWTEWSDSYAGNNYIWGYWGGGTAVATDDVVICTFKAIVTEDAATGEYAMDLVGLDEFCDTDWNIFSENEIKVVSVPVTVFDKIEISLDKNEIELTKENAAVQLNALIYPEELSSAVKWTSNNNSVATVSENGLVTRVGEGTAVITVELDGYENINAACTVTVLHECGSDTLTYVKSVDADCYNSGNIEYYECACGKLYLDENAETEINAEDVVVTAFFHPAEYVSKTDKVEVTHVENGNIEYWTCSLCGDKFSDETCETKVSDIVISALGHDDVNAIEWEEDEISHFKACSCGQVLVSENHTFEWRTDKEARCTETGLKHEECTVCGYVRNADTVIVVPHNTQKYAAVEPTCTAVGNIEYYVCRDCGKCFSDSECTNEISMFAAILPALGHSYGDWIIDKECTCTSAGLKHKVCSSCGDTATETTLSTGHDIVKIDEQDATCTEDGNIEHYFCNNCSGLFTDAECENEVADVTISAKGHDDVTNEDWSSDDEKHFKACASCSEIIVSEDHAFEWITDKDASCTETGIKHEECVICGFKRNENTEIIKNPHTTIKFDRVEPSCQSEGNIEYYFCSSCLKYYSDSECTNIVTISQVGLEKIDHIYGDWITETEPTCDTDGSRYMQCINCYETITETIEKTGHDYTENIVEPTCTKSGYTQVVCDVCGDSDIKDFVEPQGHEYTSVVTPPTSTEEGYTTYTCERCGDTYKDDFVDPSTGSAVTGTVTSFGSESDYITVKLILVGTEEALYTVVVVGDSAVYTFDAVTPGDYVITVSKNNHVSRTYEVTVEDEEVTQDVKIHLLGDINGDGKVNTLDVARANAHAKGVNTLTGYELLCADVNGDGKVNTLDVARMNAHAKGVTTLW